MTGRLRRLFGAAPDAGLDDVPDDATAEVGPGVARGPGDVAARTLRAVKIGDLDAIAPLVGTPAGRTAVRTALAGPRPAEPVRSAVTHLAILAAGRPEGLTLAILPLGDDPRMVGAVVAVCRARGSAWSQALLASAFAIRWSLPRVWRFAYALVGAGVVPEPTADEYVVWALYPPVAAELEALALADPALVAVLRRAFDARGAGLALGRNPGSIAALVGALDARAGTGRARFLDDVLTALDGPLSAADLRGWRAVLDHLAPTTAELADRSELFVTGLGHPSPVSVGVAQRALAQLVAHDPDTVDGAALVSASRIVLARPEKGLVKAQLRLLTDAHKRSVLPVDELADCLQDAVEPDRPDLTALVEKLLRTVSGPRPGAAVRATVPAPAPVDLPEPGALDPVRDAEELVELLAHVLARPGDPVELERAYDGMVRLRSADSRAARTLVGAARDWVVAGAPPDRTMSCAVSGVVLTWLGVPVPPALIGVVRSGPLGRGEPPPPGATLTESPYTSQRGTDGPIEHLVMRRWTTVVPSWIPSVLTARRTAELRDLVGSGTALLSTPTRADGSLDGATLLQRLRTVPRRPHDLGTALLRLDPADRHLFAADLPPALRDLGGRSRWTPSTHPVPVRYQRPSDVLLWQAAHAPTGSPDDPVTGWLDTSTVLGGWSDHLDVVDWHDSRWAIGPAHWSSVLVHDPDLLGAHLLPLLVLYAEKPRADLARVAHALGAGRVPLGAPAASALVRFAGFRDLGVRVATAEALAAAALRGTLDGRTLGDEVARLVVPGGDTAPKVNRIAATLTDAARIHQQAEVLLLDTVRAMLPVLRDLRGAADLLEPAAQVAERRGMRVDLPPDLDALARGRASTRVAAAARRLAAV